MASSRTAGAARSSGFIAKLPRASFASIADPKSGVAPRWSASSGRITMCSTPTPAPARARFPDWPSPSSTKVAVPWVSA
jgi:hypothetical protein